MNEPRPEPSYSAQATSESLGISTGTLRNWARAGKVQYTTTVGGHRRYRANQFTSTAQENHQAIVKCVSETVTGAIYCRVSSAKQKDDLQRQEAQLQEKYPTYQVFKDICSGLNYKRKGLTRLLEQVQRGMVKEVVVAHKDRLARFGTEIIEWVLKQAGVPLVVLDRNVLSPNEELTQDLMAIVHVFSCRLNGKRRYAKTKPSGTEGEKGGPRGTIRPRKKRQVKSSGPSAGAQSRPGQAVLDEAN